MATQQHPLSYYLSLSYPYTVVPDNGAFFIEFPDLPGCMTQVRSESEISLAAEEIRTLWIETAYEENWTIPEPMMYSEFSGKFMTRIPKSLHRDLVMAAKGEGMSLNAYVGYLLANRNTTERLSARIDGLESQLAAIDDQLRETAASERETASVR